MDPAGIRWRVEVGLALQRAREEQGFTYADIAGRLKLRQTFIAAIEEGEGRSYMDETYELQHIRAIARLLNIDVDCLL